MYQVKLGVELGNYRVLDGEYLPTKDLSDNYQISWDSFGMQAYTVIMLDIDAPYPNDPTNAPYIHLMQVNVRNGKGDTVVDYTPPAPPPDSDPHRYEIYLFKQSCQFNSEIVSRSNFNLLELLVSEDSIGQPMQLVGKLTFYGDPNLGQDKVSESPTTKDLFSERYDANKLTEEDYRILGDVYGIEDAYSLSPQTLKVKINKILSHEPV